MITFFAIFLRAPGCLGSIGLVLLAGVTSLLDSDAGSAAANAVLGVVVAKKGDGCRQHAHNVHKMFTVERLQLGLTQVHQRR